MTVPADDEGVLASWYEALLSAAVVGVDRRPPPELPAALGRVRDQQPEPEALLDQAAVGAGLIRGGRVTVVAEPIEIAPPETLPWAPDRAARQLRMLLDTPPSPRELRSALLARWLAAAAHRRVLVPPEFLPELSALATNDPVLRAPLTAVQGARGAWLEQTTGRGPATAEPGIAEQQVADPVAAMRALRDRWPSMPARAKAQAIAQLSTEAADDDFLEECLNERSTRVADAARDLLRRMPASRLNSRMAARLRPLIHVERRPLGALGPGGGVRITVHPPQSLDAGAARDGLPARMTETDRTDVLRRIVSAAPLSTWTEVTGLTPEQIAAAVEHDPVVRPALAAAVGAERSSAWAVALNDRIDGFALVEYFTPEDREKWALRRVPTESGDRFPTVLAAAPRPWSEAMANAVLDRLCQPVRIVNGRAHGVSLPAERAVDFPPSVLGRLRALLDQPVPDTTGAVGAASIVERRRRLAHAALTFHAYDRSIQEAFE